jgi:hypothetical protein
MTVVGIMRSRRTSARGGAGSVVIGRDNNGVVTNTSTIQESSGGHSHGLTIAGIVVELCAIAVTIWHALHLAHPCGEIMATKVTATKGSVAIGGSNQGQIFNALATDGGSVTFNVQQQQVRSQAPSGEASAGLLRGRFPAFGCPQSREARKCVVSKIIWRSVSELFGVVWSLHCNTSQRTPWTRMAAMTQQNQTLTILDEPLASHDGTLALLRRSSEPSAHAR